MPESSSTVSSRYGPAEGETYFSYQAQGAETAARIAVGRFQPHISAADRVVDFGCGTGWLLNVLVAGEKLGIEPNPSAREIASSLGIATVATPAEVGDAHADVVISNHALEHSLSPYHELCALHRILRPGGRLVLGLPIDDRRGQRGAPKIDPDHHLYSWTPLLISNLLTEAGFRVDEARAFTYLQPYYNHLLFGRIPRPAFDVLARGFGAWKRYRQLLVVADRPDR